MTRYFTDSKRSKPPVAVFVSSTIVIFFLSLSAADSVGFVPCYVDGSECGSQTVALSALPELGNDEVTPQRVQEPESIPTALPTQIAIPTINLDLPIQNPETRSIEALDVLLKNGPVRYVDSARLGEKGNVLIFAHTSHLPVVKNQMYKAFNRIPELEAGDSITVQGEDKTFLYTVTSVRKANAEDAMIDLSPTLGQKLTLVTCDTLTSKSSRYILEADFVGVL